MKNSIPYTKEIPFDGKLAEICSISLEHELQINDTEIEGNFIVSGEYKAHEVSVNKETFTYKLPFSVEVTDRIKKDSISFEIQDFTYEILNNSILKVDILFEVSAEEIIEAEEVESVEEEPLSNREEICEEISELFEEKNDFSEEVEEKEELDLEEEQNREGTEERLDQESAELILNSANDKEDEFTTYYIHLVKTGDTLESIVSTYQTDLATLQKYNTLDNLNVGDKIIIPSIDE